VILLVSILDIWVGIQLNPVHTSLSYHWAQGGWTASVWNSCRQTVALAVGLVLLLPMWLLCVTFENYSTCPRHSGIMWFRCKKIPLHCPEIMGRPHAKFGPDPLNIVDSFREQRTGWITIYIYTHPHSLIDFNTLCTNKNRKKYSIGNYKICNVTTTWENLKTHKTALPRATTSCFTFDRTSRVQPSQKVV